MTDYFALLDQPRRPWLDPEELKEVFHQKTLATHPDAQTQPRGKETFTQLNEAYQVLREPKRRLHHLLDLEGISPAAKAFRFQRTLQSFFPVVAAVMQNQKAVIRAGRKLNHCVEPIPR